MYKFSKIGLRRLETCHIDLQMLAHEVIRYVDHSILCGFRDEEAQEEAFRTGRSSVRWPYSKHNQNPSLAMDIAPYPIDWSDTARFARLFGVYEGIAAIRGVRLRWGGDWNGNWRTKDERLIDMPHVELVLGGLNGVN